MVTFQNMMEKKVEKKLLNALFELKFIPVLYNHVLVYCPTFSYFVTCLIYVTCDKTRNYAQEVENNTTNKHDVY